MSKVKDLNLLISSENGVGEAPPGNWARMSFSGILMWNKCRLVSRRPCWKIYNICTFWILVESKLWNFWLMIMYCFAFFFFSCEERLFQRYLSEDDAVDHGDSDDYYSASQEELRWKEGEAAQSQLWVMQTARFLPRIHFFFLLKHAGVPSTWSGLKEFIWILVCFPWRWFSQQFLHWRLLLLP